MGGLEIYKMTMLLNSRSHGLLTLGLRVVLAGLFAVAGGLKLFDPAAFAVEISRYQLIPWWSCALLALLLPWLEVCVGIGLLTRWFSRGALVWVTALLIVFSPALLTAMLPSLTIHFCFFALP